ncbi:phage tail tape measure C-terminal domain-containing protein [Caballeronia sp. NCTM5]|uniref:phage tail tape measure C-terminal domain-containing protein n=1 Tax=Caballeronia sp. NCTM5 TaxID=2921755 RepID=UPI0020285E82|nr:phage tail tape measure C-terminal domain-containing protein [Caballeronia sp. NCTM5]
MASAGSLIFELAADVSRLRQDMAKAQQTIKSSLDSIAKSSAATAFMTGAQFALDFARGFADKMKAAIDQADAIGKLAQRIGTTTEAISGLNYAAEFAGVSLDDLTTSFKELNKSLLESKDPASDASAAFKALGLDAAALRQMDSSQAFNAIATAFTEFKDGAEKAAVATALFGKQGQALIPLLNQGADGIKAATDEAERMGLIVSESTAKAMGDLNDDLTRMSKQSEGAAAVLATALQPAFKEVIAVMQDAQKDGTTFNTVLNGIAIAAKAVIGTIIGVAGTIVAMGNTIGAVSDALTHLTGGEWGKIGDDIKRGYESIKGTIDATSESMTKVIHIETEAEKKQRESAAALGALAGKTDEANKKTLAYTDTKDKLAASLKKTKQAVDEYARMLEQLQDQYRKLAAEGDPMAELLSNPKYQAMSDKQQQSLRDQLQSNIDLQRSIDATTGAKEAQLNADEFAYQQGAASLKQQLDEADAMWDLADATKAAIDPTIAYNKAIADLDMLLEKGAISTEDYAKRHKQLTDELGKTQQKLNPVEASLKSLQQAIEGFGKQSSDAMVDFVFKTKDVSVSFSEMVTSILKDLAKMLVYQNVMQPLFGMVSTGVTGGGWTWGGSAGYLSASAIARMSGGPVSPGQLYEVNELPGRREYFIPNMPGKIVTDAGAANGSNVTVNVHMNRDDSATQDTAATNKQAAELGNRIAAVVRQVLVSEKRTGGILAPSAVR